MSYRALREEGAAGGRALFTFHGTGGDETQFHGLGRQILPEARIVSPRGDVSEHGANRYFRRTGEGVYDMDDLWTRAHAMADFVVSEAEGAMRTSGLGYSNGANILAAVAMVAPERFDDLVLLHPLIPWTPDPVPGLAGRRVLVTAGERDPICPERETRRLLDWLADQGAAVETLWHPGGHEIRSEEIEAAARFLHGA